MLVQEASDVCLLLQIEQVEYKRFLQLRLYYLALGDVDMHPQKVSSWRETFTVFCPLTRSALTGHVTALQRDGGSDPLRV